MKIFIHYWYGVVEFMRTHPQYVAEHNAMGFMSKTGGDTYNLCHCKFVYVRTCSLS